MDKNINTRKNAKRKISLNLYYILFRLTGIILILTILSVWMTCGIFARYSTADSITDFAKVAIVGNVSVSESKAVLETSTEDMVKNNSLYKLDNKVLVSSNTYKAVPGTVIPKDPFIELDGTNEVSCKLYIEVVDSSGVSSYEVDEALWEKVEEDNVKSAHDGTIYKYKDVISECEDIEKIEILKDNKIFIKETYADKSNQEGIVKNFSIEIYAYLIQCD